MAMYLASFYGNLNYRMGLQQRGPTDIRVSITWFEVSTSNICRFHGTNYSVSIDLSSYQAQF